MAWCINIEPLSLRNIKVYEDHIQIKYDWNKCDQAGVKVSMKNIYANPLNPFICSFLSLAIYLCLTAENFKESEYLFKKQKEEEKNIASKGYTSQLKEMFLHHVQEVKTYVRLAHANAHGWRKGAATYATSGTTAPPSISAVARRGEWSMGKVLDVYWQCSEVGDHYLGRVVAGLNALKPSFNVMPPHFKCDDPMSNPDVQEAMYMMYRTIIDTWKNTLQDPDCLLVRLLASVVYHLEWIKAMGRTRSDHPFNTIPLMFASPKLIDALTKLVTIEPSIHMKEASGIPPHVEHSIKLQNLLEMAAECITLLKNQVTDIKKVSFKLFIYFKYGMLHYCIDFHNTFLFYYI